MPNDKWEIMTNGKCQMSNIFPIVTLQPSAFILHALLILFSFFSSINSFVLHPSAFSLHPFADESCPTLL
jgi:hypothetical protein